MAAKAESAHISATATRWVTPPSPLAGIDIHKWNGRNCPDVMLEVCWPCPRSPISSLSGTVAQEIEDAAFGQSVNRSRKLCLRRCRWVVHCFSWSGGRSWHVAAIDRWIQALTADVSLSFGFTRDNPISVPGKAEIPAAKMSSDFVVRLTPFSWATAGKNPITKLQLK